MENKKFLKDIFSRMYDNTPEFKNGVAIVSINGKYGAIMVGGREIVSPIYDALSDFVDGFAIAKLRNEERTINLSGQIQVNNGMEKVFLPQEYDWGCDFVDNICIVEKIDKQINWREFGWLGIVSIKNYFKIKRFEELLPCEYNSIKQIKAGFFLVGKKNKYGIVSGEGKVIAETNYDTITISNDKYFRLEKIENNYNQPTIHYYCIIDEKGTPLTPTDCTEIAHTSIDNVDYWIVEQDKLKGVYCNNKQIVPRYFEEIKVLSDSFECTYRDNSKVVYNLQGQVVLNYFGRQIVFPSDYIIVLDSPIGLFRAMKDEGWGVVNQKKEELIPHKYVFIEPFLNGFAKIEESIPDEKGLYLDDLGNSYSHRYGLIDTTGTIVLSIEYDVLKYCDGYWIIKKDCKYGLLSSSLSEIIPPTYSEMEYLKNGFFNVVLGRKRGLIDNSGKEILPLGSFDRIEVFGEEYFKLIRFYEDWTSDYRPITAEDIGIANQNGKIIVEFDYYNKASYIDYGMFILYIKEYAYLFNLQGERIYQKAFVEIKKREDGLFSLKSDHGWGVGGVDGDIIIETEYLYEIKYEGETATIQVDKDSKKQMINRNGRIIVHDGENEVMLPEGVYWGTDFTNGISIVRGKTDSYYKRNVIGVADVNGNIIIPTKYTKISLLSNNTIRVEDEDCYGIYGLTCYGIYDLKGSAIFPPIFTLIKYVAEDRVRVCWNLNIAKEWNNAGYIPGPCEENDKESVKFLEGYRATLCNLSGEIVCDKDFLYVGTFVGQYASAYKEVCIENGKRKFKKGGVIDVTGKTIIKPIYDGIKLYENIEYFKVWKGNKVGIIDYEGKMILEPIYNAITVYENLQYARIVKNGRVGLAHLQTKHMLIFDNLDIKRASKVDPLGRCAFSEDAEGGTWGVISINGIVVPSGKYHGVKMLDNGLIKTCDKNGDMLRFGLLDEQGKEIVPSKYSYISTFENDIAMVCIGGELNDDEDSDDIINGGKWGVVDKTGRFVINCDYDNIELLRNGLIKVTENNGDLPLFGLFNEKGEEILPVKYSYISYFNNNRATICLGGEKCQEMFRDEEYSIINGKWGVVDINGEIKIDCVFHDIKTLDNGLFEVENRNYLYGLYDKNGKELLPVKYKYIYCNDNGKVEASNINWEREEYMFNVETNQIKVDSEDEIDVETQTIVPNVIITDEIPEEEYQEPRYGESYDEDSYDDYDGSYRKYGGYNDYDDNTIDEAFEGDPSYTWNVD